jgi:ABC-type transport system involved in multi-copper enzyme maturation permease subunit
VVALHEVVDGFRSRRALALFLLYLLGSVGSCLVFIKVLHSIEGELVSAMGLTPSGEAGSVTATLWQSDSFKHMMGELVGDRTLASRLLAIPPLALFYGWLSFFFAPLLVLLLSSPRIAEEVGTGSVRYLLVRTGPAEWCSGKLAGQAVLLMAALLLSAAGAWVVGYFRFSGFQPLASIPHFLGFALKAWIYTWPFLCLALAVSQFTRSPVIATAAAFVAFAVIQIISGTAQYFTGEGWRRLLDVVYVLTPRSGRLGLWTPEVPPFVSAAALLAALGLGYFLSGYAFFVRRDR